MFWTKLVLVVTLAIASADEERDLRYYLTDEFIAFINRNQTLWKAGRNFNKNISFSSLKILAGTLPNDTPLLPVSSEDFDVFPKLPNVDLQETFDARVHWPMCATISEIRDQGSCGSCWAVAPAAVMTDRICIRSNGNDNFYFSGYDILTCCPNCSLKCKAGSMPKAWGYCRKEGVVSGGPYNSAEGCKPYGIPPCYHPSTEFDDCNPLSTTEECSKSCDTNYGISYESDKTKCQSVYMIKTEQNVMGEIFRNGPVTATFEVHADFLHYKSGVYQHVSGPLILAHSVKVLGWGVEDGVKYWLAANTWSNTWGEEGFFKILRGENHLGIEGNVMAGLITKP